MPSLGLRTKETLTILVLQTTNKVFSTSSTSTTELNPYGALFPHLSRQGPSSLLYKGNDGF